MTSYVSHAMLLVRIFIKKNYFAEMVRLDRDYYCYHYLNQSGCGHVLTKDDQRDFQQTLVRHNVMAKTAWSFVFSLQKAMEITGFTPDEISGIFELMSGILNLGNIQFQGYTLPNSTDASKLKRREESEFIIMVIRYL